ncbi:MAG: beta-propeller fold lactonase family protein [Enterocloster bolteae]
MSSRGHDSIGVFSISKENGSLTPIQWISTQGKTPRSFCMDSGGQLANRCQSGL